jgi:hypothetical protein
LEKWELATENAEGHEGKIIVNSCQYFVLFVVQDPVNPVQKRRFFPDLSRNWPFFSIFAVFSQQKCRIPSFPNVLSGRGAKNKSPGNLRH